MANCCGQTTPTPGAQAMAPQMAPFNLADVPESMVLVEYTGLNMGTTLWGGAGSTPSARHYQFGANDHDRIKYVDRVDVKFFLDLRENTKPIFRLYDEPAQPAQDPAQTQQTAQDGPTASEGDIDTDQTATAQEEAPHAVEAGNMDQDADPNAPKPIDFFTDSIVDPDKPTVTEWVEPAPEVVEPKAKSAKSKSK